MQVIPGTYCVDAPRYHRGPLRRLDVPEKVVTRPAQGIHSTIMSGHLLSGLMPPPASTEMVPVAPVPKSSTSPPRQGGPSMSRGKRCATRRRRRRRETRQTMTGVPGPWNVARDGRAAQETSIRHLCPEQETRASSLPPSTSERTAMSKGETLSIQPDAIRRDGACDADRGGRLQHPPRVVVVGDDDGGQLDKKRRGNRQSARYCALSHGPM